MANISGEQTLSSLFNGNFYRIPDYQRGYAWEKEQLEDFGRIWKIPKNINIIRVF